MCVRNIFQILLYQSFFAFYPRYGTFFDTKQLYPVKHFVGNIATKNDIRACIRINTVLSKAAKCVYSEKLRTEIPMEIQNKFIL